MTQTVTTLPIRRGPADQGLLSDLIGRHRQGDTGSMQKRRSRERDASRPPCSSRASA